MRSSISSSAEPGIRFGTAAKLTMRTLRSRGAAYPELAAYLAGRLPRGRVGLILSGGNANLQTVATILSKP